MLFQPFEPKSFIKTIYCTSQNCAHRYILCNMPNLDGNKAIVIYCFTLMLQNMLFTFRGSTFIFILTLSQIKYGCSWLLFWFSYQSVSIWDNCRSSLINFECFKISIIIFLCFFFFYFESVFVIEMKLCSVVYISIMATLSFSISSFFN